MAGKKKTGRARRLFHRLVFAVGVIALCVPAASDVYAAWEAARERVDYASSAWSALDDPARQAEWDNAAAYNDRLAGREPSIPDDEILQFDEQLADAKMWLSAPAAKIYDIRCRMGTDEATLAAGVGFWEGGATPVGGEGCRIVATCHSGMRNMAGFDNLRSLSEGDRVYISVMGETHAYEVYATEVVWPEEVEKVAAEPGRDLLTLVTCTPYGVNDHRLLVHCERVEYDPEGVDAGVDAFSSSSFNWGLFAARVVERVDFRWIPAGAAVAFVAYEGAASAKRRMGGGPTERHKGKRRGEPELM